MSGFKLDGEAQFESSAAAADFYRQQGWEPIPLRAQSKLPSPKWKAARTWTSDQLAEAFSPSGNVGIALGSRSSNLVDIDLDCPEAVALGKIFLPDLISFGRASSQHSHRLAYCDLGKSKIIFQIPKTAEHLFDAERTMLVELRSTGHQTMFPPSTHPCGESVRWHGDPAKITSVEVEHLVRMAGLVATLAVVLNRYPRTGGDRDNVCMALTGALLRAGFSPDESDMAVTSVAELADDEEAAKRGGKAAAAAALLADDEPVWGLPELCSRLEIKVLEPTLRKWLGGDPKAASLRSGPTIVVSPGHIPQEVDQAEQAMIQYGVEIYQNAGRLVRVIRLDESDAVDAVRRPSGALTINQVPAPWLREQFSRCAEWQRVRDGVPAQIDPPHTHAITYLQRNGEWKVPVLRGVISCPTLRADGSLLQVPGFDRPSGLLYVPAGVDFPSIPDQPTRDEARAALEVLSGPIRKFAFKTGADKSVALAAILTALVRRTLPTAPLFAIDAPTAGSGKSILSETVGVIAAGHKSTIMTQGKTAEEDEKRLSSVLMAGDPVIVIDNCVRPLEGDFLCSALSQEFVSTRILGRSEITRVATNVLILATGNNLAIAGDVSRRALICRLDTNTENPERLQFDFDPRAYALERRPELVAAGLTILRAYIAADRPAPLPSLGSFEDWNYIREALVWLGEADPLDTQQTIAKDDPTKGDLVELLHQWRAAFLDQEKSCADLNWLLAASPSEAVAGVINALINRTGRRDFNSRSVGRHLAKHVDRIVAGLVLRSRPDPSGTKRYWVESISEGTVRAANSPAEQAEIPF